MRSPIALHRSRRNQKVNIKDMTRIKVGNIGSAIPQVFERKRRTPADRRRKRRRSRADRRQLIRSARPVASLRRDVTERRPESQLTVTETVYVISNRRVFFMARSTSTGFDHRPTTNDRPRPIGASHRVWWSLHAPCDRARSRKRKRRRLSRPIERICFFVTV